MHKPQVVVFDLGKVLLDFDYGTAARNLAEHCELSPGELLEIVNQSALLHRYETGAISTEQFFDGVRRQTKFRYEFDRFEPLFADIFTPIPEMIGLNERLRSIGVPTWIFSNTNDIAIRHIRERYPFFRNFSGYVLSYEHRAMKPHPSIYEVVERSTGAPRASILYIDDRPENVEQGIERGWKTVLHRSSAETIAEVRRQFSL